MPRGDRLPAIGLPVNWMGREHQVELVDYARQVARLAGMGFLVPFSELSYPDKLWLATADGKLEQMSYEDAYWAARGPIGAR